MKEGERLNPSSGVVATWLYIYGEGSWRGKREKGMNPFVAPRRELLFFCCHCLIVSRSMVMSLDILEPATFNYFTKGSLRLRKGLRKAWSEVGQLARANFSMNEVCGLPSVPECRLGNGKTAHHRMTTHSTFLIVLFCIQPYFGSYGEGHLDRPMSGWKIWNAHKSYYRESNSIAGCLRRKRSNLHLITFGKFIFTRDNCSGWKSFI